MTPVAPKLRLASVVLVVGLLLAPAAHANPIDLNKATAADLEGLPGIGPEKAKLIVDHRAKYGAFASIDALDDVQGIGPATIENVRQFLRVVARPLPKGPPLRIDINKATVEQLIELPGITLDRARAIADERLTRGPFATCGDLTRVLGIGPATVASLQERCTTTGR